MKELSDAPALDEVEKLCSLLEAQARQGGYNLNKDADFVRGLVRGLLVNEKRYGYRACPCRLASGEKDQDQDIICPCNYRDADLTDFGACYCALYVSKAVLAGKQELSSIPERRPPLEEKMKREEIREEEKFALKKDLAGTAFKLSLPVWRCMVCGYLCAREAPPEVCPICKVGKERFERFI